jgi:putative ABC transport system permease protein
LVIACINFVNLTVARSLKRTKEIGIRKVIGGKRKLLILQFLGESFLLSALAFLVALIVVQLILPFFNEMANKELSMTYLFDKKIILSYFILFIATVLLAGFYPAIVLSGFKPVDVLYGKLKYSKGAFLQRALVVLQFTLSGFLIVVTIIFYSQFNFLTSKDLGYKDQHVLKIEVGDVDRNKAKTFANVLLENQYILKAAPHNQGSWFSMCTVNGNQEMTQAMEIIDENYLSTYDLKVVEGRNFSTEFPSDSSTSVLVNQTFAKEANWKNPIGQQISLVMRENKYTVVGVVKDYHFESLHEKIKPQLFMSDPAMGSIGEFCILLDGKNSAGALEHITKSFHSFFPTQPYSYQFVADQNQKQYDDESKWKKIITFSALLTIFISCIGLYGLATLSAENKKKEIGIRKVLGASISNIVTLQIFQFLKLVLLATIIAFPMALWIGNKFLDDYPYRIEISAWMFIAALLSTSSIAIITISSQALKASLSNPVKSLRTE